MTSRSEGRRHNSKRRLRYFFHDGQLHRVLYINRPDNTMHAWSYPQRKRVHFAYNHIKKAHQRAFTTSEVSEMVNRNRDVVERYILNGHIAKPAMTYTLDGTFKPVKYMWSEKDILDLHDYLVTVHYGRPRKDGLVTPYPTPSKSELRAMMKHDVVYYVENSAGEKIKAFKEHDW